MDVEKFVLENIDAMACELRPVEYISNLIAAAIAHDREERGGLCPIHKKVKVRCYDCIEAAIDQDREERESGDIIKLNREALAEIMADPLAAKLERLAEGRDYIKLSWMAKQWRVQAGKHECYADTPLAAVDAALEEVE